MKPVIVNFKNLMQEGSYVRTMPPGDMSDFPDFKPFYTPKQMLEMGVFEGKYLNSCTDEYPADWFENAKLSDVPNPKLNFFRVKSRKPSEWWKERNLFRDQDPRGWFEWYCRFWMGRRSEDDARQIQRQRMMVRHTAQIILHGRGDLTHRIKQRQTLLQWSWNIAPDVNLVD